MTYFFYNRTLLFTLAVVTASLALTNLVVDPYGVFNTKLLSIEVEPSSYYNKVRHLERFPHRYSGYMLGSSAIGFTPTDVVEKYFPGARFYNLWTSSATQYENLAHLKYLVRTQSPKQIYLQVDLTLGMTVFRHDRTHFARRMHPAVLGEPAAGALFEYLTAFPVERIREKIAVNLAGRRQSTLTDFGITGTVRADMQEAQLASNAMAYVGSMPAFRANPARSARGSQTKRNIEAIRQMRDLCRENAIRLITFIHPEHRVDLDGLVVEDYVDFLRQLAEITDFWDFSGYNSITMNDTLYYEPGHYRPEVSRLIAARIFNDNSIEVPLDFGVFVTRTNFEEHANALRTQFSVRDASRSPAISATPGSAKGNQLIK